MSETMTRPEARTLVLNAADNIAVALANLEVGTATPQGVTIVRRVPRGHKFATQGIRAGEAIVKFGQIIGFATVPIGSFNATIGCLRASMSFRITERSLRTPVTSVCMPSNRVCICPMC